MAFVCAVLYVMLYLLSPAEIFPALAPYHILVGAAVITTLLSIPVLIHPSGVFKLPTQALLLVGFFLWVSGSWVFHRWFGGVLSTFESLAPNLVVYFVALVQFRTPSRLRLLRLGLVIVAVYIFIMAVSQIPEARATGLPTPYVMAGGDETRASEVRIRGLGMLHDPNYYGQFLLMLLPFLYVGSNPKGGLGIWYLFAVPTTLVMLAAIYLTNSRGSQLGLLLLIGFVLWKKYRRAGALAAILLGPVAIIAINATRSRTISIASGVDRLTLWSDGLGMFKSSPIWGIGYYRFSDRELLTTHNTYLLCAAEMGLIGFFLWMSLIVVTVMFLRRVPAAVRKTDPVLARWAEAITLSLYGYLFTSFFLSRLYDLPLYLLIGMAGAVIISAGGEEKFSLRGTHWPAWAGVLCVGLLMLIYILVRLRMVA